MKFFKRKEKRCPNCNQPLKQGHRTDKCGKPWGNVYEISNNKMYVPSEYKGRTYEIFRTPRSFSVIASGSIVCGEPITPEKSMQEYTQGIKDMINVLQVKLNKIEEQEGKIK